MLRSGAVSGIEAEAMSRRGKSNRVARAFPALLIFAILAAPWPLVAGPLEAVVGVRATVPGDARTAGVLGTQREGSGVVIRADGLVLTIGYLILEAESAEVLLPDDKVVPAEIVAYDYDTGFGLLRPLAPLDIKHMPLGRSAQLDEHSEVLVASFEAAGSASPAYVVSRRSRSRCKAGRRCSTGSCRRCSASRRSGFTCSPNTPAVPWCPTC